MTTCRNCGIEYSGPGHNCDGSDLVVNENSINAYKESKMTFNVKTPGKFFFKINDKIIWVLGDTKWEMVKRWFGRMKDE